MFQSFLQLLAQLTEVGNVSREQFLIEPLSIRAKTLLQRGRLEDVVVNSEYRGCYKLTLDCKDRLIPFYESLGFKREPNNANYLNMRFPAIAEQSHL
ncbi:hypothetical protein E2986_08845 [Frieseomelitta varia]|uniref:Glucosamine 6-phosphate N-acetyltransferase n=1 Tax=Frieseomelitta varia TaxID=561572 RepID=A0A833WB30_9HYME|nr:hypothetical protein E2986_08845 [Frieseomelitta varia]